ncbi:HAMP domain-containing protein, partial [Cognatilysobacter terrigena]
MTEATARRTRSAAKSAARPPVFDDPLQALLAAMTAVGEGNFDVQLPGHWDGIEGRLAAAFNEIVVHNRALADELGRVRQAVGREGQTRQRIAPAARRGQWAQMERSVNELVDDLVRPVDTITEAIAGVSKGDLTRFVPLDAEGRPLQGEFLRSATIVNRMIEQMGEFSSEVTRVALEVGT